MGALESIPINVRHQLGMVSVEGMKISGEIAITPNVGVEPDGQLMYLGGWQVTHMPSGRPFFTVAACFDCARLAAKSAATVIGWDRYRRGGDSPGTIGVLPDTVKAVVLEVFEGLDGCTHLLQLLEEAFDDR